MSRAVLREEGANPPRGFGPCHWRGPLNLSRRGEFACGDTRDRVSDQTRRSGIKLPDDEELNHERPDTPRGAQGLAGKSERRRCRTAQACSRWVRGSFSFLPAEIASASTRMHTRKLCHAGAWTYGDRSEDNLQAT